MLLLYKDIDASPFDPNAAYAADESDLVGIDVPIKFASSTETGWTDQTSVNNLCLHGPLTGKDKAFIRTEIVAQVGVGFASLSSADKAMVVDWAAVETSGKIDKTTMEGYFTGLGDSAAVAMQKVEKIIANVKCMIINRSYKDRWNDKTIRVLYHYLDEDDVRDFESTIRVEKANYMLHQIIGQTEGGSIDGLTDWIDSINGFVGAGLTEKSYTLNGSLTLANFKISLKEVLNNDNLDI